MRRAIRAVTVLLPCLALVAGPGWAAPAQAALATTTISGWSTTPVAAGATEEVVRQVTVRTGDRAPERRVLLQHRAGDADGWTRIDAARSGARGLTELRAVVPASGWLRVKVPATDTARAALSARTAVTVAAPAEPPAGYTPSAYEAEVLRLTNELRAQGTTCGSTRYGPRPPLTADPRLGQAARDHALDMGQHRYFSHVSRDGSSPGDRATRAGYRWSTYAENIAAGQRTPADVVAAWQRSEGHCRNLMGGTVHLGVGYASVPGSPYGSYWVQLFGSPA